MELKLQNFASGYQVDSFSGNAVTIGKVRYTGSIIVTPKQVIPDWQPQHPEELSNLHLEAILTLGPELILIGTGDGLRFPDSAILKDVIKAGIGIDFMDNRATCRTYNLLAAEGRQVAAGIIIDSSASGRSKFLSATTDPVNNLAG